MSLPRDESSEPALSSSRGLRDQLRPYLQLARVDHWFKNAFMLLGVALAFFSNDDLLTLASLPRVLLAFGCTCLVASSNYVLNECLDAPFDRLHPVKRNRPAALGLVGRGGALLEWLLLAAAGLGLSFAIGPAFGWSATTLWVMGCVYNVPPLRSKEVPYLDVLSESINNPIRLCLGWYALIPSGIPRLSLILAYWMAGAFFMATKRLAELRHLGDREKAAAYRRSFRHYNEARLLVSMMFYASSCSLFIGMFILRYKLELLLAVPFVAGFFAAYLRLGLQENSPVQNPEKLYRVPWFFAYALWTTALFLWLMVLEIPALYDLLGVTPPEDPPYWALPL